jgi:ABC-type branched-subunit amino acid transport system substrate-binding protein
MRALWRLGISSGLSAVLLLDASSACSPDKPRGPAPRAPDPIIIGVSLGLTGGLSSFTAPLQDAIRVAEAEVNAVGGIFGRPVSFRVVDDKSDEDKTLLAAVNGVVNDGAIAFIGPAGSSQVVAVQDLLRKNKIIDISPSATSPDLTSIQPARDRYLFRTTPPDDLQGKAVVLLATQGAAAAAGDAGAPDGGAVGGACRRMGIVHIDNAYGNAMTQVIADFFPTKGGQVIFDIPVPVQVAADYKQQVAQVMAARPDCMALIVYDDVGDQFMLDLQAARTAQPTQLPAGFFVIGTDGIFTSGFIINGRRDRADPKSPTAAEGVVGTNPDTNPRTREYYEFKNLFAAHYPFPPCDPSDPAKSEPAPYTANIFDAAILAVLAIQRAGTRDRAKIRDALFEVSKGGKTFTPAQIGQAIQAIQNGEDVDYKGASGGVDFDDYGNIVGDYIMWKVEGGAFKTIGHINVDALTVDTREPPPCQ